MKFEAPRCLSLMGFTDMANVKQHQIIGSSVQVLVANPDDKVRGSGCKVRGQAVRSGVRQ